MSKNDKVNYIDFERDDSKIAIFPISNIFGSDDFEYKKPSQDILGLFSEGYI